MQSGSRVEVMPKDDKALELDKPIPGALVVTRQIFKPTTFASAAQLLALNPGGPPQRKFFDETKVGGGGEGLFRLKWAELPDITTRWDSKQPAQKSQKSDKLEPVKVKRADKYFNLLMKRHEERLAESAKQVEEQEQERAAAASWEAVSKIKDKAAGKKHFVNEEEDHDFGTLTAYSGALKLELEVVVCRAPGEKIKRVFTTVTTADGRTEVVEVLEGQVETKFPTPPPSEHSTPRIDFSEEMRALAEEMKDYDSTLPEDQQQQQAAAGALATDAGASSGQKAMPTFPSEWKDPYASWTVDAAGTLFWVPDAERYALQSSLPPPPPPSLHGRRRVHLKPRLPLEISNHRYRDEHPHLEPADAFRPAPVNHARFEQKMMTFDFYRSCSDGLVRLPRQQTKKDEIKQREEFANFMEKEMRRSQSWKNWRKRDVIERKEREEREKAEREKKEQEERERTEFEAAKAKADEEAKREQLLLMGESF